MHQMNKGDSSTHYCVSVCAGPPAYRGCLEVSSDHLPESLVSTSIPVMLSDYKQPLSHLHSMAECSEELAYNRNTTCEIKQFDGI